MTNKSAVSMLQRADLLGQVRGRLAITSVVIGCVAAGSAIGAGTHTAPSAEFRSESELTVSARIASFQPVAWRTFRRVLELPELRAEIAQLSGAGESALRIGTLGDPQSSLITVYADGSSASQADSLANVAAAVAINYLRQAVYPSAITRSTFHESTEGWDVGSPIYVLRPTQFQQTRKVGRAASGSAAVTCTGAGCGPYLVLKRRFSRGATYLAVGWVKAPPTTRMRLVLGSTPQDVAVGAITSGGQKWRRLSVDWTPRRAVSGAVVTFQVTSSGISRFNINDVEVGPRAALQTGARHAPTVHYSVLNPAAVSATLGGGDTAAWAAGGAAAGLLVGVAAAAAATAAARNGSRKRLVDQDALF